MKTKITTRGMGLCICLVLTLCGILCATAQKPYVVTANT